MNQQNFVSLQQPEIIQSQMNGQQLAAQQQINQQQVNQDEIGDIINEINNQEPPQQYYTSQQPQYINESYNVNKMYDMNELKEKGIIYLKKIVLIVIIYMIITSEQFMNISSKYINVLKPDENGKLKVSTKIFYGIIIAIFIILSNEFILNSN